jgi:hypothetical protein
MMPIEKSSKQQQAKELKTKTPQEKEFYHAFGIWPNERQLKEYLRWKEVERGALYS